MDSTTTSIFVFGIYLIFVGAGFLLIPNILLPLFRFPKTDEPWIRVSELSLGWMDFKCFFITGNAERYL
jgi:hypothetical protein